MTDRIFQKTENGIRLKIRLSPRSSVDQIEGVHGDMVKIKIKAPPVDGKANAALIKFLAKILNVRQRDIRITSGESSRNKTIEIVGLDSRQAASRMM
jgi:uncharacterized protein (TIGR00251 family)